MDLQDKILQSNPLLSATTALIASGLAAIPIATTEFYNNHPTLKNDFPTYHIPVTEPISKKHIKTSADNTKDNPSSTTDKNTKNKNDELKLNIDIYKKIEARVQMDQRNIDANPTVFTAFTISRVQPTITRNTGVSDSGGFATIETYYFNIDEVMNTPSVDQNNRINYLMNLFQEYRLKHIGWEWEPGINSPVQNMDSTNFAVTLGTSPNLSVSVSSTAIINLPWDVVIYRDRNDSQPDGPNDPVSSNLSTMYRIWHLEECTGAHRFKHTQYTKGSENLVAYASIADDSNPIVNPTTDNSMTRPIDAPWIPTKVLEGSTWSLNTQPVMSSVKIAYYNRSINAFLNDADQWVFPVIAGDPGVTTFWNILDYQIPLGTIRWKYILEFRMREFRQIYTDGPSLLVTSTSSRKKLLSLDGFKVPTFVETDSLQRQNKSTITIEEEKNEGSNEEPSNKKPRLDESK